MTEAASIHVSVIVPFWNAERTLGACLDSLLEQDFRSFEIVAVDDHSTDGSAGIAASLQERHARGALLRVLRPAGKSGAQAARMEGVSSSKGEIIAFIDADCVAPPSWLALMVERLTPDIVAVGGRYRVPPGLPLVARFETYSLEDFWFRHLPPEPDSVATGCCAVHRRCFTAEVMAAGIEFADLTSGDDTLMSLALSAQGTLRYDPDLWVYHYSRTTLGSYLDQQSRRGQSRSRISAEHFEAKVRKGRDLHTSLILAQIASTALALAAGIPLLALGRPVLALLTLAPFVWLQLPLLARVLRASEGAAFVLAALPLAFLRNLAWGWGGLLGALRIVSGRRT